MLVFVFEHNVKSSRMVCSIDLSQERLKDKGKICMTSFIIDRSTIDFNLSFHIKGFHLILIYFLSSNPVLSIGRYSGNFNVMMT